MGLFSKKRGSADVEPHPDVLPSLRELVTRLQALELAHDDLVDQFRRFRGRTVKRMSLDLDEAAASPTNGNRPPTMQQLKSSGRWPLR